MFYNRFLNYDKSHTFQSFLLVRNFYFNKSQVSLWNFKNLEDI